MEKGRVGLFVCPVLCLLVAPKNTAEDKEDASKDKSVGCDTEYQPHVRLDRITGRFPVSTVDRCTVKVIVQASEYLSAYQKQDCAHYDSQDTATKCQHVCHTGFYCMYLGLNIYSRLVGFVPTYSL